MDKEYIDFDFDFKLCGRTAGCFYKHMLAKLTDKKSFKDIKAGEKCTIMQFSECQART